MIGMATIIKIAIGMNELIVIITTLLTATIGVTSMVLIATLSLLISILLLPITSLLWVRRIIGIIAKQHQQ